MRAKQVIKQLKEYTGHQLGQCKSEIRTSEFSFGKNLPSLAPIFLGRHLCNKPRPSSSAVIQPPSRRYRNTEYDHGGKNNDNLTQLNVRSTFD